MLRAPVRKANRLCDFDVVKWNRRGLQREKSCLRDSTMSVTPSMTTVTGVLLLPIYHAINALSKLNIEE